MIIFFQNEKMVGKGKYFVRREDRTNSRGGREKLIY